MCSSSVILMHGQPQSKLEELKCSASNQRINGNGISLNTRGNNKDEDKIGLRSGCIFWGHFLSYSNAILFEYLCG